MTDGDDQGPARPDNLRIAAEPFPAERLKVLRDLVMLCFADGRLKEPLCLSEDGDPFRAYALAMFPRTTTPPPPLTDEERIELQRRIDNRHNAISHEEFVKRVVRCFREHQGNE
jgi:hypothetical protein